MISFGSDWKTKKLTKKIHPQPLLEVIDRSVNVRSLWYREPWVQFCWKIYTHHQSSHMGWSPSCHLGYVAKSKKKELKMNQHAITNNKSDHARALTTCWESYSNTCNPIKPKQTKSSWLGWPVVTNHIQDDFNLKLALKQMGAELETNCFLDYQKVSCNTFTVLILMWFSDKMAISDISLYCT